MVTALVERRHTVGSRGQMRARMRLALDLGDHAQLPYPSETSIRNWQSGTVTPAPVWARAIQQRYDVEVGDGKQG